jgi:hypothetical protein
MTSTAPQTASRAEPTFATMLWELYVRWRAEDRQGERAGAPSTPTANVTLRAQRAKGLIALSRPSRWMPAGDHRASVNPSRQRHSTWVLPAGVSSLRLCWRRSRLRPDCEANRRSGRSAGITTNALTSASTGWVQRIETRSSVSARRVPRHKRLSIGRRHGSFGRVALHRSRGRLPRAPVPRRGPLDRALPLAPKPAAR